MVVMVREMWSSCSSQDHHHHHHQEYYNCVKWVEKYFKDCVCNLSSEISFTLGLVSLFFWAIAEIPQIITNFHSNSAHGVSLPFLFTWILGDIFNLVGCLLEPLTLPTQFYTALLYTSTTVVLLVQTMYYDYWLKWWKNKAFNKDDKEVIDEIRKHLNADNLEDSTKPFSMIKSSPKPDIYYMSARSLARSGTPPYGSSSYLVAPRSGPSAILANGSSSEDDSTSPTHRTRTRTRPMSIPTRSVGYGTILIASSIGLPFQSKASIMDQVQLMHEMEINNSNSTLGLCLGWIMAAIYIGGRLPQIYLNIKRGSVEGLNPLMFIFALLANATYVGSILARSIEWERIKANAPWLLDAIVCVT